MQKQAKGVCKILLNMLLNSIEEAIMDFLIFQLYGVLASWGDIAVGEKRPTQNHPSKSAIMGLLAGVLGIKRHEDKKHIRIDQDYGMAVCTRWTGEEIRDFHTIQVPSTEKHKIYSNRRESLLNDKLNTILSYRDYRMEALCQVAIWKQKIQTLASLEDIQKNLQYPKFVPYLGRKSCPMSLPVFPKIFSKVTLKQALDQYHLECSKKLNQLTKYKNYFDTLKTISNKGDIKEKSDFLGKSDLIEYFWSDGSLNVDTLGMTHEMSYPCTDQIISRKRWQFAKRTEYYYAETTKDDS